jgi:hypothetical protein
MSSDSYRQRQLKGGRTADLAEPLCTAALHDVERGGAGDGILAAGLSVGRLQVFRAARRGTSCALIRSQEGGKAPPGGRLQRGHVLRAKHVMSDSEPICSPSWVPRPFTSADRYVRRTSWRISRHRPGVAIASSLCQGLERKLCRFPHRQPAARGAVALAAGVRASIVS